mmetsp:Transcript_3963/g.3732  ORF Transcript_3963/g.3732 Transcript_3963/m.3732 type:complete len:131 (+) Transcript_3963:522-914(+)
MSEKVTQNFYKIMTLLFENYRACLNQYGWDIVNQFKRIEVDKYHDRKAFTSVKPPSYLPQVANRFIKNIMLSLPLMMSVTPNNISTSLKQLAIDLTKHFCDWLIRVRYSDRTLEKAELKKEPAKPKKKKK